jgi:NADPH2:quinone reductase
VSKAFRFHEHGGPEVLRFEDVEIGAPGPAEVRIRNVAVAVNYRDVLMRRGVHAVKSLPSAIGLESAGVIDALGRDVRGLSVGDRVAYAGMPEGSYAELRIVPAARVIQLPAEIDERTAASMMIRGMTARCLLTETYKVRPGDTILIHAAAGGIGSSCANGRSTWRDRGRYREQRAKADIARVHGCIIRLSARARTLPRACAASPAAKAFRRLRFGRQGDIRSIAEMPAPARVMASFGETWRPDPCRRAGRAPLDLSTHPSVSNYTVTRAELLAAAHDLFAMVGSGRIKIAITETYPLRDAPRAHADIESRKTTGSIVLVV